MKEVGGELGPGTSTLFVLAKPSPRRAEILGRLRPFGGTLATSTMSPSDEWELRAAYEQTKRKST
jgi:uncharacterized membrane protein